jgi:hypothetical protein
VPSEEKEKLFILNECKHRILVSELGAFERRLESGTGRGRIAAVFLLFNMAAN